GTQDRRWRYRHAESLAALARYQAFMSRSMKGTMVLRSVLIISPHFPPINAPDHQRVRMALPYFREFGWEPVVLAVAAEFSENSRDETLTTTLPENVEIHRVRAMPAQITRTVGMGSLALRSLPYLHAKGKEILASRKFDLV